MSPARHALAWVLVAASACGQYLTPRASGANTSPSAVTTASVGDVDGNGLPEAFLQTPTALSMIPNAWNATPAQIAAPVTLATCSAHTVANVNGDAFPDLLVAVQTFTPASFNLAVMLGTGTGTFSAPVNVANLAPLGWLYSNIGYSNIARPLVANDFNGDGLDDVIVFTMGTAGIFLNAGPAWTLGWTAPVTTGLTSSGNYSRLGDFNGDGLKDLAVAWSTTPLPALVWYGVPGGLAATPTPIAPPPATNGSYLFDAGDLDGDGYDDVVIRHFTSSPGVSGVWVLYGGPAGLAYVPQSAIVPGVFAYQFPGGGGAILDLDADGIKDLVGVAVTIGSTTFAAARGLGNRAFSYTNNGTVTAAPGLDGSFPIYADLDGDSDTDAFAFSLLGSLHTVLDNRATVATACAGAAGVPSFPISPAWWGNPSFFLGLAGAAPNAPAALVVSTSSTAVPGCGLGVWLLPASLILPSGTMGFVTTSPTGTAVFGASIPMSVQLYGFRVFAQWGVLDPAGTYPFGGATWAMTPTRTICVF